MTNPKPLFTAGSFTDVFENFGLHRPDWMTPENDAMGITIANRANEIAAPLQAENAKLVRAVGEHLAVRLEYGKELERLREDYAAICKEMDEERELNEKLRARVANLEAEQGRYIREIIEPLSAKVKSLSEALEFYAKPSTYSYGEHNDESGFSAIEIDEGDRARAALKQEDPE
jgi:hypothetical protein